jgi:hypothetical protein
MVTGAGGWPLTPSLRYPGELALTCPWCGSQQITLTVAYGPGGRLGDPGAHDIVLCESCKRRDFYRAGELK